MQITTLPVYSRLAEQDTIPPDIKHRLPHGLQLSCHQLETYLALTDPNVDIVINTAMTGDGKSLAAYLPSLINQSSAFGMYPTNELVRDQSSQLWQYNKLFQSNMTFDTIWGAKLGSIVEEYPEYNRRSEALAALLRENQITLTNPDIFHLILNYRYGSHIFSDMELPYTLAINSPTFIFDEFHIFQTPQIVSAITAILFFHAMSTRSNRPRFIFSSATPGGIFDHLLKATGLRVQHIEGTYCSSFQVGYRQVLHESQLHLYQLGEKQNVEQWIEEHLDIINDHWLHYPTPRPRGVIIVNSVVEARRIAKLLNERLNGITVGENTGFTDDTRRKEAMKHADLIVGTSTIDVGVDFNISLLIFEAPDAGTFLQRFGRLGRCRRDGTTFGHYEAHALFSGKAPWLYDSFVKKLADKGIGDGDAIERPTTLREAITETFPAATNFQRYIKRWGALQAAHIIATLEHYRNDGSYKSITEKLRTWYQQALGLKNINSALGRYRHMMRGENEPGSTTCKAILDEILSFRGSSPFQICLWDDSVSPPAFLSYNALVIAQNSDVCLADTQPFQDALKERYPDDKERRNKYQEFKYGLKYKEKNKDKEYPVVLYVDEFITESERLLLRLDQLNPLQINEVSLFKGLAIERPKGEDTKRLNTILRKQSVVGYITRKSPLELRRLLRLPAFFPLYQVEDSHGTLYTLALGQAALLLEAEALWLRKLDEEEAPIII